MSIKVKGVDELKKALAGIEKQFSDKIVRKANTSAAEPLVHEMHRRAPVGLTGNLADSIGIVNEKKSKELGAIGVGPRRKGGFKGFAGHLNEFGTKRRRTRGGLFSSGANRGVMPKKPFVAPSWESQKDVVLGRVQKELSDQITKYLKRTAPK